MNYWVFKVSDRGSYPDSPGAEYVYDNTHSVRVAGGDEFIYLKKESGRACHSMAFRRSPTLLVYIEAQSR